MVVAVNQNFKNNIENTEQYYSVDSAAKLFDCSPQFFRNLIRDRRIFFIKIGRLVRIPHSALMNFKHDCPTVNDETRTLMRNRYH